MCSSAHNEDKHSGRTGAKRSRNIYVQSAHNHEQHNSRIAGRT